MKYTKSFAVAFLCVLPIFASSCTFGIGGGRGEVVEAWESTKGNFKIRVTEYQEKYPVHLTHFMYVFESSSAAYGEWHEIMYVKNDDDIPLPREQIQFVNDQTGYVFMNEKYAVSTDGGGAWKVWEATSKNLPKLQQNLGYIKNVQIELDGTGTMTLDALDDGQVKTFTVYTKDYGQHWSMD